MRPSPDLLLLARQERRLVRKPELIACLDALIEIVTKLQRPKPDRKDYMREYMAKYRAKAK